MKEEIKEIFDRNIELLELVDKSVIYFRESHLDMALGMLIQTADKVTAMADAIIQNKEYFRLVSTDSIAEMVEGILEARRNRDYVLLADLLEVQLSEFICNVQELIMRQEDYFAFNEEKYFESLKLMNAKLAESLVTVCGFDENDDEKERLRVNHSASLNDALNPAGLLEQGYAVELTSCGLMTVAAEAADGSRLYLHSNGHVSREAFLLAKKWLTAGASTYIVYGLGLGYHIRELTKLSPDSRILVFESDMNMLRLFCAFSDNSELLRKDNISFIYDPEFLFIDRAMAEFTGKEKICIHYPSFRRIKNDNARELLALYIPWYKSIREIEEKA